MEGDRGREEFEMVKGRGEEEDREICSGKQCIDLSAEI